MDKIKLNLVLKNGAVYTVDKQHTWAQAVAIADRKIAFVGTNADVDSYIDSDTAVIDPVSYTHLTLPTTPYV